MSKKYVSYLENMPKMGKLYMFYIIVICYLL